MLITADENIPFLHQAFSRFGEIQTLPGRSITRSDLVDTDVLLVRSVTRVGPELLEGTPVRFVGTATIGTDHLDTDFLERNGITWASAPGSNADSVADYVTSAVLELERRGIFSPDGKTAAVIGFGNVGSRVTRRLQALGMTVLLNDPPLQEKTGEDKFLPLGEVLPQADLVTLHVPLEANGPHPTLHLAGEAFFGLLKPGAVLMNTSRGKVLHPEAFLQARRSGKVSAVVLDVFPSEPALSTEILAACDIATPHIAGYALDGKARGTLMLHQALCRFLEKEPFWDMETALPPTHFPTLELPPNRSALPLACLTAYDVSLDDARLRKITLLPQDMQPAYFDRLRKDYPFRREFRNTEIRFTGPASQELKNIFSGLTFQIA